MKIGFFSRINIWKKPSFHKRKFDVDDYSKLDLKVLNSNLDYFLTKSLPENDFKNRENICESLTALLMILSSLKNAYNVQELIMEYIYNGLNQKNLAYLFISNPRLLHGLLYSTDIAPNFKKITILMNIINLIVTLDYPRGYFTVIDSLQECKKRTSKKTIFDIFSYYINNFGNSEDSKNRLLKQIFEFISVIFEKFSYVSDDADKLRRELLNSSLTSYAKEFLSKGTNSESEIGLYIRNIINFLMVKNKNNMKLSDSMTTNMIVHKLLSSNIDSVLTQLSSNYKCNVARILEKHILKNLCNMEASTININNITSEFKKVVSAKNNIPPIPVTQQACVKEKIDIESGAECQNLEPPIAQSLTLFFESKTQSDGFLDSSQTLKQSQSESDSEKTLNVTIPTPPPPPPPPPVKTANKMTIAKVQGIKWATLNTPLDDTFWSKNSTLYKVNKFSRSADSSAIYKKLESVKAFSNLEKLIQERKENFNYNHKKNINVLGREQVHNTPNTINFQTIQSLEIILRNLKIYTEDDIIDMIRNGETELMNGVITRQVLLVLEKHQEINKKDLCNSPGNNAGKYENLLLKLLKIPHIQRRLDSICYIHETEDTYNKSIKMLETFERMLKAFKSPKFIEILKIILFLGNYINSKYGISEISGFQLSSIHTIMKFKINNDISFMDYIIIILKEHFPSCLKITEEFEAIVNENPEIILTAEKELEGIKKCLKIIESEISWQYEAAKDPNQSQFTSEKLRNKLIEFRDRVSVLIVKYEKLHRNMEIRLGDIAKSYGEDSNVASFVVTMQGVSSLLKKLQRKDEQSLQTAIAV